MRAAQRVLVVPLLPWPFCPCLAWRVSPRPDAGCSVRARRDKFARSEFGRTQCARRVSTMDGAYYGDALPFTLFAASTDLASPLSELVDGAASRVSD